MIVIRLSKDYRGHPTVMEAPMTASMYIIGFAFLAGLIWSFLFGSHLYLIEHGREPEMSNEQAKKWIGALAVFSLAPGLIGIILLITGVA